MGFVVGARARTDRGDASKAGLAGEVGGASSSEWRRSSSEWRRWAGGVCLASRVAGDGEAS